MSVCPYWARKCNDGLVTEALTCCYFSKADKSAEPLSGGDESAETFGYLNPPTLIQSSRFQRSRSLHEQINEVGFWNFVNAPNSVDAQRESCLPLFGRSLSDPSDYRSLETIAENDLL